MSRADKTQKVVEMFDNNSATPIEQHISSWDDTELAEKVLNGESINTDDYSHLAFMADWRTVEELIEETIRAWLIEDLVKQKTTGASLDGSDSNRKIAKTNTNITTDPDLEVDGSGVEVVADYGGYWVENGTLEMRANKWEKMDQVTTVIAVDVENAQFIKFEKNEVVSEYIDSYPPFGGKSVYSIDISDFEFSEF